MLSAWKKTDEFRNRLGSLYEMSRLIRVGPLDGDSVKNLVRDPLSGKIAFSDEALEDVLTLSENHPHLVQYLCNKVVETAQSGSDKYYRQTGCKCSCRYGGGRLSRIFREPLVNAGKGGKARTCSLLFLRKI